MKVLEIYDLVRVAISVSKRRVLVASRTLVIAGLVASTLHDSKERWIQIRDEMEFDSCVKSTSLSVNLQLKMLLI